MWYCIPSRKPTNTIFISLNKQRILESHLFFGTVVSTLSETVLAFHNKTTALFTSSLLLQT